MDTLNRQGQGAMLAYFSEKMVVLSIGFTAGTELAAGVGFISKP
jgi:hypothetical protein